MQEMNQGFEGKVRKRGERKMFSLWGERAVGSGQWYDPYPSLCPEWVTLH